MNQSFGVEKIKIWCPVLHIYMILKICYSFQVKIYFFSRGIIMSSKFLYLRDLLLIHILKCGFESIGWIYRKTNFLYCCVAVDSKYHWDLRLNKIRLFKMNQRLSIRIIGAAWDILGVGVLIQKPYKAHLYKYLLIVSCFL